MFTVTPPSAVGSGYVAEVAEDARFVPNTDAIDPGDGGKSPKPALLTAPPGEMAGAKVTLPDVIVKTRAFEVPPPGSGLNTVTATVPALAKSLALIEAVSLVALASAVLRLLPFQSTVDPDAKPDPASVSVNPGLPAAALETDSDASAGGG